jgi:ABC-type glycerol-3-phosphate transport system substrate-binding protein
MTKKYYILGGVILLLLIVMIGLLTFSSGGNTPKNTGNVELTWWKTFENEENVQQMISDYQALNNNVTINYVKKDIATYENDLLNAFASGNPPDIISIHNDWLPEQLDRLEPVPEALLNLRNYKSTFVDVASDDFVRNGKIYAVPLNIDLLVLFYNKDLLGTSGITRPPTTWKELASNVEKITKQDKPGNFIRSGVAFGTSSNVNRAVDIVSLLMLQGGTKMYSPDFTYATFDQEQDGTNPGALALQYFTQFADPSKSSYTWNAKSDNSVDAFTQNKLAMMLSYYYMRPQILDKGPNINWEVAAVPQISETSVKVNLANYWGEAVAKNSKNPDVAWDFLNFITSKDSLTNYYTKHKLISSRKDILATQINDTEIGVYAENALTAKSVFKKDAGGFETVFSNMIDDVSARGLTPSEAINNAAQQIDLQLSR